MAFGDRSFDAVLFDLDGTLVDTAPDMVAVLQQMQRDHGIAPVAYDVGRSNVSNGAAGLLKLAFPDEDTVPGSPLYIEYLDRYGERLCRETALFEGLEILLERLEGGRRPWGIVTNKPERMTRPLLEALGIAHRSACTVSGDTLPQRKPDPAPMLHACTLAGIDPGSTIYVGDAARDIEAGRGAGMGTIAVTYGYITADDDPARWGADLIANDTADLARNVLKAVNLEPE